MAKVLLIQPHRELSSKSTQKYTPPASLVYVATAIKNKHPVKIYDRNVILNDNHLICFIKEFEPDIVGFTSMTSTILEDIIHLGPIIKKEFPKIIIIVGGVHATAEPESFLKEQYIDYVLRGEGEEAFLEFCNVFDKNPKRLGKLKNINLNPLRSFVKMDDLEFPDYSLIDLNKYRHFFLSTSRGCPGKCTFCYNIGMWGKNGNPCTRFYSTEKTKEFFKHAIGKYKITDFTITDENFTTFKKRCIEVCDFLEKNYKEKINMFAFARSDFVDNEVIRALKKAGCHTLQFGLESGSQKILNSLNKQIPVATQAKAVQLCKKNNVFVDGSFMIGLPDETMGDLKMTENFIKKNKPETANIRIYNPLPGSQMYDDLIKKGLLKKPKTLRGWIDWQKHDFRKAQHNFSKIPDKILEKFVKKQLYLSYNRNLTKFKKIIFWIRRGRAGYILKTIIRRTHNSLKKVI